MLEGICIHYITPRGRDHSVKRLLDDLSICQGQDFARDCEKYLVSQLCDSMFYEDRNGMRWDIVYIENSETVGIYGTPHYNMVREFHAK